MADSHTPSHPMRPRPRAAQVGSRKSLLEALVRHLSLVKVSAVALTAIGTLACTGDITNGFDPDDVPPETPEQIAAREQYESGAYPVLQQVCKSCHQTSAVAPAFLDGADAAADRVRLLTFEPTVVNLEAPASSRVLTKGSHSGPPFNGSQAAAVLQWIELEAIAAGVTGGGGGGTVYETAPHVPALDTLNEIPLDDLGSPGSKITFIPELLASGLYLQDLKLVAGASGVYVKHPLFLSWNDDNTVKSPDSIDRYFATEINLMPATEDFIEGGTAAFVNFPFGNAISVSFRELDVYREGGGGGGGGGGGCAAVAEFTANAKTPLMNACAGCHAGGNPNARSAVDMSNLADDTMAQEACNQILLRISEVDPTNSGLFIAVDPSRNQGHPFEFGGDQTQYNNFFTALSTWIDAEVLAP